MTQEHRRGAITLYRTARGTCRVCREAIFNDDGSPNTRKTWHPGCLELYFLATDPGQVRAIVRRRDHGACAKCGSDTDWQWEADHILPLIDGGGFGLDNLQTLCLPCHRAKTAREARERAARRAAERSIEQGQAALELVVA